MTHSLQGKASFSSFAIESHADVHKLLAKTPYNAYARENGENLEQSKKSAEGRQSGEEKKAYNLVIGQLGHGRTHSPTRSAGWTVVLNADGEVNPGAASDSAASCRASLTSFIPASTSSIEAPSGAVVVGISSEDDLW